MRGIGERIHQRLRSQAELDDEELRSATERAGCRRICDCTAGERVVIAGRVRSVTVCPVVGSPQFEIEVYDGSGKVRVVWIGRRQVRGIGPGREIRVRGRLTTGAGEPTVFNPEYDLLPMAASG